MLTRIIAVSLILFTSCQCSTGQSDPSKSKDADKLSDLSLDDYLVLVSNKEKLVLVDFTAVWCGPCKMMKPILKRLEKSKSQAVEVLEIDVDKNPLVSQRLNIRAIPLIILYQNGKEVWRNMGVVEEETLLQTVERYL